MFEKIEVNGENTHDLYKYLRRNSETLYDDDSKMAKQVPWNFAKFLVDSEGKVLEYYRPQVNPVVMKEDL